MMRLHTPRSTQKAYLAGLSGEWTTALASVQEWLNRMQAERDESVQFIILASASSSRCHQLGKQVVTFDPQLPEVLDLLSYFRRKLVAARAHAKHESSSLGLAENCCNGDGFCPLCDKGRA